MTRIEDLGPEVWNRFFDFLFVDESELTREQVQDELKQLRVDLREPEQKLRRLLKRTRESREARLKLEAARKTREPLLAGLLDIHVPSAPDIRTKLMSIIKDRLKGPEQAVYARKLETASSDEDLKSLLEDISRLDAFSEESDDAKP